MAPPPLSRLPMSRLPLRLLLIALLQLACALPAQAQEGPEALFRAIDERLGYMHDVALAKARSGSPVEDLTREAAVLDNAAASAADAGLDPASALPFYRAQMAAAKAIQYRHLADWQSTPPAPDYQPRDLATQIRPALLRLDAEITRHIAGQLRRHGPYTEAQRAAFDAALQTPQLGAGERRRLFDALTAIRLR